MRLCVAGAGLLALVGCNQVFGIQATREYDASVDVLPDLPYVKLTWQVAELLPSGAQDPEIRDLPIQPAPRVRHAALTDAAFTDAEYASADGMILVNRAYFEPGTTWRLEYTLADNVPHEVQWSPEDKQGHLTVPVFGRLERDPVPLGGGYRVTPTDAPAFTSPRMFTTGLWTEGLATVSGTTIDYNFSDAISLSGSKGRPDPTRGDHAVLIDYRINAESCRVAVGSAALASAELEAGKLSTPAASWDSATKGVTSSPVEIDHLKRVSESLSWLGATITGTRTFGVAPSANMPGVAGRASPNLSRAALPVPVMLSLLECPYEVTALPSTAQPVLLQDFPRIQHAQLVIARKVNTLSLASGMEATLLAESSGGFTLAFPAAIPTTPKLVTPANGTVALDGPSEAVDAGPAPGTFTLLLTAEPGTGLGVDYYEVTLHRLAGAALITERVYTVPTVPATAPTTAVQIDGGLLTPGAEYVFQVRSFSGHPNARQGDFRPVAYPYGSAVVFTRTFKTR